jgi:hypothetical protein
MKPHIHALRYRLKTLGGAVDGWNKKTYSNHQRLSFSPDEASPRPPAPREFLSDTSTSSYSFSLSPLRTRETAGLDPEVKPKGAGESPSPFVNEMRLSAELESLLESGKEPGQVSTPPVLPRVGGLPDV